VIQPLLSSGDAAAAASAAAPDRPGIEANRLIPSYGMNAFKSLARSHPETFARHHPDLECLPDGQVVLR